MIFTKDSKERGEKSCTGMEKLLTCNTAVKVNAEIQFLNRMGPPG